MRESAVLMRGSSLVVCAALLLSWSMAAVFPLHPAASKWSTQPPEVPFVLTPWAAGQHVRSSVYYLVILMITGFLCAVPLEIAKLVVAREEKSTLGYLALTLQQIILFADVIRSHGWDWWIFLLDMTHLIAIDRYTWMEGNITTVGSWPWPSAITTAALGMLLFVRRRSNT